MIENSYTCNLLNRVSIRASRLLFKNSNFYLYTEFYNRE